MKVAVGQTWALRKTNWKEPAGTELIVVLLDDFYSGGWLVAPNGQDYFFAGEAWDEWLRFVREPAPPQRRWSCGHTRLDDASCPVCRAFPGRPLVTT